MVGGRRGVDVVPLLGALPMCCGVDVVPLLGAIVVCYGAGEGVVDVVPLLAAIAIAICHCNVLWWGARVTTIFERVDVVPLLGAIAGCQSLFHMFLLFSRPPISPRHPKNGNEFCLELLADVTLLCTLLTQNLVFAIWGLCWYNFFLKGAFVPVPRQAWVLWPTKLWRHRLLTSTEIWVFIRDCSLALFRKKTVGVLVFSHSFSPRTCTKKNKHEEKQGLYFVSLQSLSTLI